MNNELLHLFSGPDVPKFTNLKDTFNLSFEEIKKIVFRFLTIEENDIFYKGLISKEQVKSYFEKDNIDALNEYLKSIGLDSNTIRTVLSDFPEILMFSKKTDDIFPLFKGSDYKGFVVVNGENYRTYYHHRPVSAADFIIETKNSNIPYINMENLSNEDFDSSEIDNVDPDMMGDGETYIPTGIVEEMLMQLSRRDIKDYYSLDENSSLKDKLYALSSNYNKRNYYFLKKRNPLIAAKAIESTRDEDGMYHCDLCGNIFKSKEDIFVRHIIPLADGGVDQIYNLSCLCKSCNNIAERDLQGLSPDNQRKLISRVFSRIERKMPDYKNKIMSYLRPTDDSSDEGKRWLH